MSESNELMKTYVGTKMVKARPMDLGSYNTYRGWKIPEDEDPLRKGYLVKYSDSYVSWSPEDVFKKTYNKVNGKFKEVDSDLITSENTYIVADENVFNAPHNYTIHNVHNNNLLCGIHFQEGPLKENILNGVFTEDLIAICIDRLENFQKSEFACEQNEATLMNLRQSLIWLRSSTNDRKSRGVQGTSEK